MAIRTQILANGEIFHIFNRATEKRVIFKSPREIHRFINLVRFYQRKRSVKFSVLSNELRQKLISSKDGELLVEILCYCIMPNHFHLLLRQESEQGISQFMRKVSDGYSRYYNILHDRVGPLFQGNFKAVRIVDDKQILHVSRYIHLNPLIGLEVKNLSEYSWSSYHEYMGSQTGFCSKDLILGFFKQSQSYKNFVLDNADYGKKIKKIEHFTLEKSP